MSRRFNFYLEDLQYNVLTAESGRSSISVAELIRRAIDQAFELDSSRRTGGIELSVGVWKRPDAAVVGRRSGVRFRRGG
ncbi:MAG: hypothetical protein JWO17_3104 [Actinomycetia bacterium]|jgi:hypothetical protein|nr:hypothetical protein [Actinomycetes bacterium]